MDHHGSISPRRFSREADVSENGPPLAKRLGMNTVPVIGLVGILLATGACGLESPASLGSGDNDFTEYKGQGDLCVDDAGTSACYDDATDICARECEAAIAGETAGAAAAEGGGAADAAAGGNAAASCLDSCTDREMKRCCSGAADTSPVIVEEATDGPVVACNDPLKREACEAACWSQCRFDDTNETCQSGCVEDCCSDA